MANLHDNLKTNMAAIVNKLAAKYRNCTDQRSGKKKHWFGVGAHSRGLKFVISVQVNDWD